MKLEDSRSLASKAIRPPSPRLDQRAWVQSTPMTPVATWVKVVSSNFVSVGCMSDRSQSSNRHPTNWHSSRRIRAGPSFAADERAALEVGIVDLLAFAPELLEPSDPRTSCCPESSASSFPSVMDTVLFDLTRHRFRVPLSLRWLGGQGSR